MATVAPIYTANNCKAAYELDWSLAVFWTAPPPPDATWLAPLRKVVEGDGVRVLEHRLRSKQVSQFLLSTRPETSPAAIARSVKGRLQHLVRDSLPKAFRRNYGLCSIGNVTSDVVRDYIHTQTAHHRMGRSSCATTH